MAENNENTQANIKIEEAASTPGNINNSNLPRETKNVEIVNNQEKNDNKDKKNLSCKEKYPSCFCKIRCVFCYNCFSQKEREKYNNTPKKECFCIIVVCYYLFFFLSQLFLIFGIIFTYICKCFSCCMDHATSYGEYVANNIKKQNKELNIRRIDDEIKKKEKEYDDIDRTITLGNGLNKPEHQIREIEFNENYIRNQIDDLKAQRELEMQKDNY